MSVDGRLLLASGSPRRRDLLAALGLHFDVAAPDIDESVVERESAIDYVARVGAAKAAAVDAPAGTLVVAADTTVELDGTVLGKPVDAADARRMLRGLSGRTHHVHTAVVARLDDRTELDVVSTAVAFVDLDPGVVDWYVGTGEPIGKAGAYALQGAGGALVARVDGSVSNVIGLPLAELLALTERLGRPLIG